MATSIPKKVHRLRGLADLPTMTGPRDGTVDAYKAFLRISCLELERSRHKQEMQKTHHRVDAIAARCREIEREREQLLARLSEARQPESARTEASAPDGAKKPRKFQLSY